MKKLFAICLCGLMAASAISCSDDNKDVSLDDYCQKVVDCSSEDNLTVASCKSAFKQQAGNCSGELQAVLNCTYSLSCDKLNVDEPSECKSEIEAYSKCAFDGDIEDDE